jgi:hypothetical protein
MVENNSVFFYLDSLLKKKSTINELMVENVEGRIGKLNPKKRKNTLKDIYIITTLLDSAIVIFNINNGYKSYDFNIISTEDFL